MAGDRLRILFLADTQVGCMATFSGVDDEAIARFERRGMLVRQFPKTDAIDWDVARLDDAVAAARAAQPDLVVIGGDMIDDIARPEQLDAFQQAIGELDVEVRYVAGNHDACHDATIPTDESLEWYRTTFGAEHWVLARPAGDTIATIIAVNSTVLDQPRKIEGSFEAEMTWLERALVEQADGPTIVCSHHPPFIDAPDEADDYWNIPAERRLPFLELLADHGVDLLLCGHRHRNDSAEFRGVEIVTSAAAGFPLGPDAPGHRIVDVSGTGITHTYYGGAEPDWDAIGGPPVDEGR